MEYEKKKAEAEAEAEKVVADNSKNKDSSGKKSSPKTIASSTSTDAFTETPSVKTANSGSQASMKNEGGSNKAAIQKAVEKSTSRLLKALHVFSRYTDYTGCKLPDEVELFGLSLLGQITVAGFEDRLSQSVKTAGLYLDPVESRENSLSGIVTYRAISDTVDKLSLEMEKDPTKLVAEPSLEMQFGDVMVYDEPVDSGLANNIFGPPSIPPPASVVAPPVNTKKSKPVKAEKAANLPPPPPASNDTIDDLAPPPYDPKAKPTAFKHPDLYSAVAPPADAPSSGFMTIDRNGKSVDNNMPPKSGSKGDPRGVGIGKPTPSKSTLDAARQRAVDASAFEKPPVEKKKESKSKPNASASNNSINNNQNKAPQEGTSYKDKMKLKDDVPKQNVNNKSKNTAPKAKQ